MFVNERRFMKGLLATVIVSIFGPAFLNKCIISITKLYNYIAPIFIQYKQTIAEQDAI